MASSESTSQLDLTKIIIKSILNANKFPMSSYQLNKGYRDVENKHIPFSSFGYHSLDDFLRSISDTVSVKMQSRELMVTAVASEDSLHMQRMAAETIHIRNRYSKPNQMKQPQARNVPQVNSNIPNLMDLNISPPVGYLPYMLPREYQQLIRQKVLAQRQKSLFHLPQKNFQNHYYNQLPRNNGQRSNTIKKDAGNLPSTMNKPPMVTNANRNKGQQSVAAPSTSGDVQTKQQNGNQTTQRLDVVETGSSEHETNVTHTRTSFFPARLLSKLQKLYDEDDSTEQSVPATRDNTPKLNDSDLDNVSISSRENSSNLGYVSDCLDAGNSTNSDTSLKFLCEEFDNFSISPPLRECDTGKGECFEPINLNFELKIGSHALVVISELNSPYKFWLQLGDHHNELKLLMNEMGNYYSSHADDDALRIPVHNLKVENSCAVLFNNIWHRGKILDEPEDNLVKVVLVDYGTITMEKSTNLRKLLKDYMQLPVQAICSRLSQIRPINNQWTSESANDFVDLVKEKFLFAEIIEIDSNNRKVHVNLIDTSEPTKDVSICEELVNRGHASFC